MVRRKCTAVNINILKKKKEVKSQANYLSFTPWDTEKVRSK